MATTFDLSDDAARIVRDYAGKLAGKANASYCVPMVLGPTGLTAAITLTLWTTGEGVRTQIDNTELGDNLYVQRRPPAQNRRDAAALGPVARAWARAEQMTDVDAGMDLQEAILAALTRAAEAQP